MTGDAERTVAWENSTAHIDRGGIMRLAPGQVSITVRSSLGEDGPLTVQDALRQVLDCFDLLSMAQDPDDRGRVTWHLVSITKASPLTAIGEAVSVSPGVPVDLISRLSRERVAGGLIAISEGMAPPEWMDEDAQTRARNLLQRNLNGIGRTDLRLGGDAPVVVIVERSARLGLTALNRAVLERQAREKDLSRTELGSIEGDVTDATTHYGRPAIRLVERVTGADVVCVLSEGLASRMGALHTWDEVWKGSRVMAAGEVVYRKDGRVLRVHADDMWRLEAPSISFRELAAPGLTGGRSPQQYLDELWPDSDA